MMSTSSLLLPGTSFISIGHARIISRVFLLKTQFPGFHSLLEDSSQYALVRVRTCLNHSNYAKNAEGMHIKSGAETSFRAF